jgi:hypothetical protein
MPTGHTPDTSRADAYDPPGGGPCVGRSPPLMETFGPASPWAPLSARSGAATFTPRPTLRAWASPHPLARPVPPPGAAPLLPIALSASFLRFPSHPPLHPLASVCRFPSHCLPLPWSHPPPCCALTTLARRLDGLVPRARIFWERAANTRARAHLRPRTCSTARIPGGDSDPAACSMPAAAAAVAAARSSPRVRVTGWPARAWRQAVPWTAGAAGAGEDEDAPPPPWRGKPPLAARPAAAAQRAGEGDGSDTHRSGAAGGGGGGAMSGRSPRDGGADWGAGEVAGVQVERMDQLESGVAGGGGAGVAVETTGRGLKD